MCCNAQWFRRLSQPNPPGAFHGAIPKCFWGFSSHPSAPVCWWSAPWALSLQGLGQADPWGKSHVNLSIWMYKRLKIQRLIQIQIWFWTFLPRIQLKPALLWPNFILCSLLGDLGFLMEFWWAEQWYNLITQQKSLDTPVIPQFSSIVIGFSILNLPAIGVPPFYPPSPIYSATSRADLPLQASNPIRSWLISTSLPCCRRCCRWLWWKLINSASEDAVCGGFLWGYPSSWMV